MDSSVGCPRFFNSCGESMQDKLDSPMPWIGMYVAAASALISIAMAADVLHGFKNKKWWLPSKYLSMNAFSLRILAISMKLPVDLTNQMLRANEILARVSSLALMSTVMANLMTSLGTTEFNEMMLNLASIGVLVITIIVNVCIHISKMLDTVGKEFKNTVTSQIYAEQIICTVFMFILLVMLGFWGSIVPDLRKHVDEKYRYLSEKTSTKQVKWGDFTINELVTVLRDHWVNARIGNPQFLAALSDVCAASGAMCLLTALTLLKAWIRMHFVYEGEFNVGASNYKWSINWILFTQSIGVGLGTIAPMMRWFVAAKLKSSNIRQYCFSLKYPAYCFRMETFIERVEAQFSLKIPCPKFRSFIKVAKFIIFIFYIIIVETMFVLACKFLLLVSAACVKVILLCFPHDESSFEIDYACTELLNGAPLPMNRLESIRNEVDKLIEMGNKKKQTKDLIKLLNKSDNFNGVKDFVGDLPPEPNTLNSWTRSIVILTSIAVQLPNIPTDQIDELLRAVDEGLLFVTRIEKSLNVELERYRFRLGAEELWSEVRRYRHCEGLKIKRRSYVETLRALGAHSSEFVNLVWERRDPAIISICHKVVQSIGAGGGETEEHLFGRISDMISNLISACLTNLVTLITFKCTNSDINERDRNVREAAILLGETQEILEMLQGRRLPGLDPDKAAHLHEWWSFMNQSPNWMDIENPAASVSAATATNPQSNEEPVIEIEG